MSSISPSLRIAVIGAGLIGERHARLIAETAGLQLCAIIDPSISASCLAEELKAPVFKDLTNFLDGNMEPDGIIIATPNEMHLPMALACIERNIPCLIEKPLAANSEDAKQIVEISRQKSIPILVGHHRRHHQVSRILHEKIKAGDLGKPIGAQLTWMLRKPVDYFKSGTWRIQKGGGPIWINLIHEIDLLRYFLGEIVEVSTMLSHEARNFDVEDTAAISMRCANGGLISALISDFAPSPWHFEGGSGENPNICKTGQDGMRIFGTEGSIEFPSLTEWRHAQADGHWGTTIFSHPYESANRLGDDIALSAQLNNFADVIRGSADPLVSAHDGLQSVRVIEAIHVAAQECRIVTVQQD